jgi:hypothetical protein
MSSPELEWQVLIKSLKDGRRVMRHKLQLEPEGLRPEDRRTRANELEGKNIILGWSGRYRDMKTKNHIGNSDERNIRGEYDGFPKELK